MYRYTSRIHINFSKQTKHTNTNRTCWHGLTSTLTVLALLTVALWRGRAVAWRLVVVTSPMLGWLLVAPAPPVATRLTSTAAVPSTTVSAAWWLVVTRSLRATFIAVVGQRGGIKKTGRHLRENPPQRQTDKNETCSSHPDCYYDNQQW